MSIVIHNDSQVIVEHVNRDYEVQKEQMKKYLSMVKERVSQNFVVKFVQIPREENKQVDRLAKAMSAKHMTINS